MNRTEFMQRLERLLMDIPANDRVDAISYYHDYFDEAGIENEAQVIRELGSPEKVAANIKANLHMSDDEMKEEKDLPVPKKAKRNMPILLIILLLVLTSPALIGLVGGVFGVAVAVLVSLLVTLVLIIVGVIACLVAGAALFVVGLVKVFLNPLDGVLTIGIGSLMLTIGLLLLILLIWLAFKWIPALFRCMIDLIQKLFGFGGRRKRS